MKTSNIINSAVSRKLAFLLVFVLAAFLSPKNANAQIEPGCLFGHETIAQIDYTFVGPGPTTYTGTYTQGTNQHVVWVMNLTAGQVIHMTYATGFNAFFWLYQATGNGIIEVGDNDPNGMTHIGGRGGYNELQGPHSGVDHNMVVPTTGQYAVLMDNYTCELGTKSYSVTFWVDLAPVPCMDLTLITNPTKPEFAAHGAGDLLTYYPGISATKVFKVMPTGGVAPYTAVWTTDATWMTIAGGGKLTQFGAANALSGYVTNGSAGVYLPAGPFKIKVAVTDANGCTIKDSLQIGYVDYTCNPPGEWWYLQVCNTQTQITSCVKTYWTTSALLLTGNYELGACMNGNKADMPTIVASDFMVYPNPASDFATMRYNAVENSNARINVLDLNGRIVQSVDMALNEGLFEYSLNLSYLANGTYFVQLISENEVVVQKIQVAK